MEMSGEQVIALPQERVWAALNDPEVLKACIPGCETIEKLSDTEFKIGMLAAVGPVKARFAGKLQLKDLNPPESYSIAFDGSGGAAGFGKGGAKVMLVPDGQATRLNYTAQAQVGGKLAQVGSRLIDGVARKMADDFFNRFNAKIAPPPAVAPSVPLEGMPAATLQGPELWMTPVYLFAASFLLVLLLFFLNRII